MFFSSNKSRQQACKARVTRRKRALALQSLENRQLLAFNVVDDTITVVSGTALNVLTNDTSGNEVQQVSAVNFDYDPATVNKGSNLADWFVPERPGQPGVPQRSLIPNSLVEEPPQSNFGDVDLWLDVNGDVGTSDDVELTRETGIALGTIRENIVPSNGSASVNLSVLNYNTDGGGNVWFSTVAAPQNDGESIARMAGALFNYADGWLAGSFNSAGAPLSTAQGSGISVVQVGTGRYEISVAGVTDSFNEGYLFAIASGNSDNYSHTMPIGGNKWLLAHRDNSANFTGGENGSFNVVFIPRSAQGLIGGHVNANSTEVNDVYASFGDFTVQKTESGLWRMSVPGHSPASGMLILETNDAARGTPGNVYLSYEADGDDFIIRQLEGNTMNPANDDFVAFFVPFENTLFPTPSTLTITSVGTTADPTSGLSESGMTLTINADGTVGYDLLPKLEGESGVDTFVYTVTDGSTSLTGTVTVNWKGANDAPIVIGSIADQSFDEDDAGVNFDLTTIFTDPDAGNIISYSTTESAAGVVDVNINGTTLELTPAPNAFGLTRVTVVATDLAGASSSISFLVDISPLEDDGVVAVDDGVFQTDNGATLTVAVLDNDFHGDAGALRVAAANISVNAEATNDAGSTWSIATTNAAPHGLSIQSAGNLGDVAVGYNGTNLNRSLGVLLGTSNVTTTDGRSINTYDAFGSYGFATDRGAGSGGQERNQPMSAAFFPFQGAWTGAWVDAAGTVQAGVGVNSSNIVKLGTGLFQVTIPGVNIAAEDGMLFAMGGNNDDNIVSVLPSATDNTWLVRQQDNDADATGLTGFEDDPWHFVYIPGTAANLIGGRYGLPEEIEEGGSAEIFQQYGAFTVEFDDVLQKATISVPGYTPAQGALIAISTDTVTVDPGTGPVDFPDNYSVEAYPSADGTKWVIDSRRTVDFASANREVQFMFLPYDQVLQRYQGLDFAINPAATDAVSQLGATITINADGTVGYDPTTSATLTALGFSQSAVDTFTYGIIGGDGSTATATVTIEVFGQTVSYQTSQGPTTYDIGSGAASVDAGLSVVELGTPALDGATLNFVLTGGRDGDLLSIRNDGTGAGQVGVSGADVTFGGTVVGTFVGGSNGEPLVVTLNAAANNAAVEAIGEAVQFESTDAALAGDRLVSFEVISAASLSSGVVSKRVQARNVIQFQQGVDFGDGAYAAAANARLNENAPDTWIDTSTTTLATDFDTSGSEVQSLLKFGDLFGTGPGQIPPDAIITSADLILSTTNPGDGATMHRMLVDWDSTSVTWNTFGGGVPTDDVVARTAFESQLGVVNGSGATGTGSISFSVLEDVRDWAAGETNFGWLLKGWQGNTDGWDFQSSEYSVPQERPQLRVEWIPAGAAAVASFRDGVDGYEGTVDTDIRGFAADADNSAAVALFSDAPETQALIRFDDIIGNTIGQIPAGARILTARLTLGNTVSDAMGDGGKFHAMLSNWSDTDTWNSLGGGVKTDGVQAEMDYVARAGNETLEPDAQGGFNTFDVTSEVERWVAGDLTNYGWLVDFWTNGSNGWGFASSEAVDVNERPRLEVYFEVTNQAPTDVMLTPDAISEFADTTGGLLVGTLTAEDPNAGDTFTYELIPGVNDNALFTITGDQLSINDGVPLDYETRMGYVVRVKATDAGGLTFEKELNISVINEIEAEGIRINDGSNQRSRVTSLTVQFDSPVTIGTGAFEVIKRGANGGAVDILVSDEVVGGKTVATVTFAGDFTQFGSLVDGNYQLRIDGSLITNGAGRQFDGDGDGQLGGDLLYGNEQADAFFRYYGDVDGNRFVNLPDLNAFRSTFGVQSNNPSYIEELDFNADGSIALPDLNAFRPKFGTQLGFE